MKHSKRMKELKKQDKKGINVVEDLQDRVGHFEGDLSIIIRTLDDLQDGFEELLNRVMDRDEARVSAEDPSDGTPTPEEEALMADQVGMSGAPQDEDEGAHFQPIVSIEPSNVTGSPHLYLYIYLTPRLAEGPHILVSDAKEFQDGRGIAVGRYEHYEAGGESLVVKSSNEMIAKIQEYMDAPTGS